MRNTLRRVGGFGAGMFATGLVALALLAVGLTVPASAAEGAGHSPDGTRVTSEMVQAQNDFGGNGVRIRANPRLNATVLGHGNRGDGYTLLQRGTGDALTCPNRPISTNTWLKIRNSRTGVTGWISFCWA